MDKLLTILAGVLLAAMPASAKSMKSPIKISDTSRHRAAEILSSMSMHDRVAQLVMPHDLIMPITPIMAIPPMPL